MKPTFDTAPQKNFPDLLVIQSNLLEDLRTTVVIPPCATSFAKKAAITMPCLIFEI